MEGEWRDGMGLLGACAWAGASDYFMRFHCSLSAECSLMGSCMHRKMG